ncbi:BMP family ABC transporter substrate-binding protein [Pyrolobus fumarii]|uniref:BMP family lipoprotein n=1 Tax=Pyrolobus fumarii TaxID=54252 RepID=UPI00064F6447
MTPGETSTTPSTGVETKPKPKAKVLVLFDVGGRGDLSFNDMAWLGAERAARELGVEVKYSTPRSQADMQPLLERLSKTGEYDVIILVGFLWTDPLNKTADKFPQQKYALIDATTGVVRENEIDILFREQECAALIGVLAAGIADKIMQVEGETGPIKIGAVAGMDIPPLWKFHIGYLFGAKYYELKTGKKVELLWTYTGTFTDTQKGYRAAWDLLQKGAKVLYGLAGLTHVGMFDAVREWNEKGYGIAFAIGQDASQEWYDPYHIILSGAKRVDVAVYTAIRNVVEGNWEGGIHTLGLKEGGVGIWDLEGVKWFAQLAYETGRLKDLTPEEVVKIVKEQREKWIPQEAWKIMEELKEKIMKGEIVFKTPKSHDEYIAIIKELEKGNLNAALEKGSIS